MKKESQGEYTFVIVPGHPMADKRGRILEHRYVMSQKLGRILDPTEFVHHKDEQKKNNHPDNLELIAPGAHSQLHNPIHLVNCICPQCGKEFARARRCINGKRVFCSKRCSMKFYVPFINPGSHSNIEELEHGTYKRYRHGCRCAGCKAANATRMRNGRLKKKNRGQKTLTSVSL